MKKRLLSLCVASALCAAASAVPTATVPASGGTYYVYNVGLGMYLSDDGEGSFALTSDIGDATAMTLVDVETAAGDGSDEGLLQLIMPDGTVLSASFGDRITPDGGEIYDQWLVTESVADSCYVIALRAKEANAFLNIRWDAHYERLEKSAVQPAATFDCALWQFVTDTEEESEGESTAIETTANAATNGNNHAAVYTLSGQKAAHNAVTTLPRGIYIVGGRKVIVN